MGSTSGAVRRHWDRRRVVLGDRNVRRFEVVDRRWRRSGLPVGRSLLFGTLATC